MFVEDTTGDGNDEMIMERLKDWNVEEILCHHQLGIMEKSR